MIPGSLITSGANIANASSMQCVNLVPAKLTRCARSRRTDNSSDAFARRQIEPVTSTLVSEIRGPAFAQVRGVKCTGSSRISSSARAQKNRSRFASRRYRDPETSPIDKERIQAVSADSASNGSPRPNLEPFLERFIAESTPKTPGVLHLSR